MKTLFSVIIATVFAFASTTASAAVVTFNFTATVDADDDGPPMVPGSLASMAAAFTEISGSFSFDTDTPDANNDPEVGDY